MYLFIYHADICEQKVMSIIAIDIYLALVYHNLRRRCFLKTTAITLELTLSTHVSPITIKNRCHLKRKYTFLLAVFLTHLADSYSGSMWNRGTSLSRHKEKKKPTATEATQQFIQMMIHNNFGCSNISIPREIFLDFNSSHKVFA